MKQNKPQGGESSPKSYLVMGAAKSGTTALYERIRKSIDHQDLIEVYEKGSDELTSAFMEGKPVMSKVIFDAYGLWEGAVFADLANFGLLEKFDKRVFIVRDPRDVLVSIILYFGAHGWLWTKESTEIENGLKWLLHKEKIPEDVSIFDLAEILLEIPRSRLIERIRCCYASIVDFLDRVPAFFLIRYEDFIINRVTDLETYLEFNLTEDKEVRSNFGVIPRTKGSGNWKHWFTQEDARCFREELGTEFNTLGFDDDWTISENTSHPVEYGSGYYKRLVDVRRAAVGLPAIVWPNDLETQDRQFSLAMVWTQLAKEFDTNKPLLDAIDSKLQSIFPDVRKWTDLSKKSPSSPFPQGNTKELQNEIDHLKGSLSSLSVTGWKALLMGKEWRATLSKLILQSTCLSDPQIDSGE